MGKQQPVIFGSFVLTAFTRWFGLNRYRVHVPWTAYIAQHVGQSQAFDAAIYCVNSIFMGHSHLDSKLQRSSREVYSKALRLFGSGIQDVDAMRSTESVSITIALSLFEAYSRTDPDSWARHAAGTSLLMAHRGPKAHLSGFDRCLYLSFRSFLVAESFVNGTPCIFERPEWQAHIEQVKAEDMASPRVDGPIALFIDLQDRIFMEVVKVPGMLSQARQLQFAADPQDSKGQLAANALRCKRTLHTLTAHLRLAAAVQNYRLESEAGDKVPFIGPIPSTFPQEFANSVLRGSDNCLYLLRLLLEFLDSDDVYQKGGSSDAVESGDADPLPFRIISKLRYHDEKYGKPGGSPNIQDNIPSADKWLDMVAASMGLEAFEIITYAVETGGTEDLGSWDTSLSLR